MIYWFLAFVFVFISYFSIFVKVNAKSTEKIFYIIVTIFLIVFAATRDHIGVDFNSYEKLYETIHRYKDITNFNISNFISISGSTNYEPLFVLLCIISSNYHLFLLLMSFLGVGLKCYVIWKECNYRYLMIFFYFCYIFLGYDMGVMRQGVAMSFMLIAMFELRKKRLITFFVFSAIAILFHSSGFLLLPLVFWSMLYDKQKVKWIITAISLAMSNVNYFLQIIDCVASRFGITSVTYRIDVYGETLNQGLYLSTIVKWGFILILLTFAYKKIRIREYGDIFILDIYWYGCVITFLTREISLISGRGTVIFFYFACIAIDCIIKNSKTCTVYDSKSMNDIIQGSIKASKISMAVLILTLFTLYYLLQMRLILPGSAGNNYQSYIPYNSWLFQ